LEGKKKQGCGGEWERISTIKQKPIFAYKGEGLLISDVHAEARESRGRGGRGGKIERWGTDKNASEDSQARRQHPQAYRKRRSAKKGLKNAAKYTVCK